MLQMKSIYPPRKQLRRDTHRVTERTYTLKSIAMEREYWFWHPLRTFLSLFRLGKERIGSRIKTICHKRSQILSRPLLNGNIVLLVDSKEADIYLQRNPRKQPRITSVINVEISSNIEHTNNCMENERKTLEICTLKNVGWKSLTLEHLYRL